MTKARANYPFAGDIRHFGPYPGRKIDGAEILTPREYLKSK
jgi:hypothetical protein